MQVEYLFSYWFLDEKLIADLVLIIWGHWDLNIIHFCKWVYMPATGLKRRRQMIQYLYVNTLIAIYMLSKSSFINDWYICCNFSHKNHHNHNHNDHHDSCSSPILAVNNSVCTVSFIYTLQRLGSIGTFMEIIQTTALLARDSMLSALYAIANPSVCPSVCPSHGWISRKRLNLGSCNFHRTVATSLSFMQYKFHPEILTGSPRVGASNEGGLKRANIVGVLTLSPGGSTS